MRPLGTCGRPTQTIESVRALDWRWLSPKAKAHYQIGLEFGLEFATNAANSGPNSKMTYSLKENKNMSFWMHRPRGEHNPRDQFTSVSLSQVEGQIQNLIDRCHRFIRNPKEGSPLSLIVVPRIKMRIVSALRSEIKTEAPQIMVSNKQCCCILFFDIQLIRARMNNFRTHSLLTNLVGW